VKNKEKKIVIVWGFEEYYINNEKMDENNGIYSKEFKVSNSKEKKLLAVKLNREASDQQCQAIIEYVKDTLHKFFGEYLLLIHTKPKIWMTRSLPKYIEHFEYYEFGGGSELHKVLYKELITDIEHFQKSAFEGDLQAIKEEVFDDIWHEYNVKRELL
jgi:hypothetical protein